MIPKDKMYMPITFEIVFFAEISFLSANPLFLPRTKNQIKSIITKNTAASAIILFKYIIYHHLIKILRDNPDYLKKKSNYVRCMDDIADSFWNMKTCMKDLNG